MQQGQQMHFVVLLEKQMSWEFLECKVGVFVFPFYFFASFFWVPSAQNLNKPSSSLKEHF